MARRSLTRLNVRYSASNLMPALPRPGHQPPVGVTFQFLLVVRPVIELSGRYSASKLMTALAQPGHQPTLTTLKIPASERRLQAGIRSGGRNPPTWPTIAWAKAPQTRS